MMNAREAREMVERTIENEKAKAQEDAMQFCEKISKEIEECASKKYCSTIITVPEDIQKSYVASILKDNGYSVGIRGGRDLEVVW